MATKKIDQAKHSETYEKQKERMAERSRLASSAGRDLGTIPPVQNPERREACSKSLRLFCETYLPGTFKLRWSEDHLKAIAKLETAILQGGLFALAMPRGSGKTSLCEAAAKWAILNGYRRFVAIIGASETAAIEMLESIKMEIETNDLLLEDYPEACFPVVALEGIHNRANGQTINGKRTRISWTDSQVVFPTVDGSLCSGSRIHVAGITGRVRGMKVKTETGESLRPDFAIADDPQTDESAVSPAQTSKRERVILGAIKGLAGPTKSISMVVPCTVIAPGDLADRMLDRERFPQFQGERFKMLYSFPKHVELWDQYAEIRKNSLRDDGDGNEATEFYRANREKMDEGGLVAWPERFEPNELSAIQSAMNLWIDNPRSFASEYQNEPQQEDSVGVRHLRAEDVVRRISGVERFRVSNHGSRLTAFIDVGGEIMWYSICEWNDKFGGSIIDYGTWPPQNRTMFSANDPRPCLSEKFPGRSEEQRIFAALTQLFGEILGRVYYRENSQEEFRIERCLVDCGWKPDPIFQAIQSSPYVGIIYPSKGISRSATSRGVEEWAPRPGERRGPHWRLTKQENRSLRMVQFDPDHWKSFIYQGFSVPQGGRTGITIYGTDKIRHDLLAEHLESESAEPVTTKGSTYEKWTLRPDRPDNHWFDTIVGNAVAASVAGVVVSASDQLQTNATSKAAPVKLSDIYRQKHGGK